MVIPISLIITTLLLGLIIFLAYIFLNKLVNKPPQSNNNIQNNAEVNQENNNIDNNNIQNNQQNELNDEFIPPENNNQNGEPFKKLTKKEQLKMIKKQEKADMRERNRLLLEERRNRELEKEKELLLKEKMREEAEKKLEEELKRVQEEQKKKDDEIYNQWKDMMKVGEEGEEKMDFTKEEVINKFLDYIKIRKVVSLEDISGTFKLSPNDIVMKLNQYEKEGRILGIIDDRGKYIYITPKEMGLIEKMFINRGRISKADLIKECNRLIRFEPTEEDKVKIAEEQQKTLKELEDELNVKK
jgi:hypothetical protein